MQVKRKAASPWYGGIGSYSKLSFEMEVLILAAGHWGIGQNRGRADYPVRSALRSQQLSRLIATASATLIPSTAEERMPPA